MEASSPFDQAMARPLLDEPTRKKWRLGKKASSWFEKTAAMAVSLASNDENEVEDSETISFLAKERSAVPVSSSFTAASSSNGTENITDLAFSLDSISNNNKSSNELLLQSTQHHPLEMPVPHDVSTASHPLALELVDIDLECADTELEIMRERQTELRTIHTDMQQIHCIQHDLAGLVDSHQSDIDRLSWNAIQAFDHTESGLENVIQTVAYQQERKSKLHSLAASIAVVLVVGYVVAGFFASSDEGATSNPGGDEQGSPKFLIRYFNP